MKAIDLTGKKFGRLTVIRRDGHKGHRVAWLCRCSCGNFKRIASLDLRCGDTKSCGCFRREASTIHGKCQHPLYQAWVGMRQRCGIIRGATKKIKAYYQGRGIGVCCEWDNFMSFYQWATRNGWNKGLEIDRIDNNGDYTPKNCRFVTHRRNNQNTTQSKRWYIKGARYRSLSEAAQKLGVSSVTIYRWCCGRYSGKRYYPPKKNCYAMPLY